MSQLFASGGQSIGASASASVLPMNIQGWFPLRLTGLISLLSKGLTRVFSKGPENLSGVRRRDSEKTVESMLVASCKSEELQEGAPEGKNWKDNTQWLTNERHDIEKLWTRMWFREGNGTPLQYSCLENPMDGGAWKAAVQAIAEGRTWLSDFTFTFHFHALEKEIATHSSVLAWRIPGTGEPGGLLSMGSHRVGHDWSNAAAAAGCD